MPHQAPIFGRPQGKRKPWARPDGHEDRRIRGRAGMKLRAQILREEPLCRACLAAGHTTASERADHIIPLSQGGGNDRSNFQGLCIPCHDEKSAAEAAAGGAAARWS